MAGPRAGLWNAIHTVPLWFRAAFWVFLLVLRHVQAHVLHPLAEWWLSTVVGTWEESFKSVIRETFSNTTRFVNGFFAWFYTAFIDGTYWRRVKSSSVSRPAHGSGERRPSTFNAVARRELGRTPSDGQPSHIGIFLPVHFMRTHQLAHCKHQHTASW